MDLVRRWFQGSTAEESIAEASRGNDTTEAEAWAERTSVITSFDHDIHCALARDFVEDIVEKVVQQAEGSRSFGKEPRSSPLPDLVKDSRVDESDESEYESADETIVDNKKPTANTTFDVTDSDDFSLRLDSIDNSIDAEDSLLRSPVKAPTANATIELDRTIDLDSGNSIHYESVLEENPGESLLEDPAGETPVVPETLKVDPSHGTKEETAAGEVPVVPEQPKLDQELPLNQENLALPADVLEVPSVPLQTVLHQELLLEKNLTVPAENLEIPEVPEPKAEETQVPVEYSGVPEPLTGETDTPGTAVPELSATHTEAPGEIAVEPGQDKDSSVPEPLFNHSETSGVATTVPGEDQEATVAPETPLHVSGHLEEEIPEEVPVTLGSTPGELQIPGEVPVILKSTSGEPQIPGEVPVPLAEETEAIPEVPVVPELSVEEIQALDTVPVVPEQPKEAAIEEPTAVPEPSTEEFKVPEVPVVPQPLQESGPNDDIPIPKKGYDLSFLDNLEDLENVSPDAIFGTKTTSKAPVKKPVLKKRLPQVKKEPTVPKRPEVPAELVLEEEKKDPPLKQPEVPVKPVLEEEKKDPSAPEQLEVPVESVLEEKKDLEKEVEEQGLIVPKKGYDLSFLDKLEDLENAAPDTLIQTGKTKKEMKETKESEPSSDPNTSTDKAPASRTEAKARINNRRIVKPRPVATRPADSETATEESNADENPFKPKNKLAASPTSTTKTFQIPLEEAELEQLPPPEKQTAEENKEILEVSEPLLSNEPASVIDLSAETFRPAAEILNDPAEMDFLLKFGGSSNAIALARQSLFANFDPLIAGRPSLFPAKHFTDTSLMEETQINESINNGDSLFVFSPPHPSNAAASAAPSTASAAAAVAPQSAGETDLSSVHLKEALKMQELLFQDRLLQKDRELLNKEREMTEMKGKLEATVEAQTQMKQILGEYEKTISQLIAEKEREKATMETELQKAVKEKDQAAEDLKEVERAFSEFHRMYERTKAAAEGLHKNEEALKKAVAAYQERLQLEQQKYETLKLHASQKLENAQQETEHIKRGFEAESARMKALLKKTEMRLASVESTLEQRNKENEELTKLCDELINRLGAANN